MEKHAMTRTGTIVMVAALAAGLTTTSADAQQISSARIQELIKQAAAQSGTGIQTPQPTGAPAAATRPVVQLTLDDAVKLALDRNLDIAVQRLNPEINDIAIASALAVYHPTLTSTLNTQSATTPANSAIQGSNTPGTPIIAGLQTYNGGVSQSVPWGGGAFNASLVNTRNTTTSLNTLYNPAYNTNWSAVYTQPILRNFQTDSNRRTILVNKINRDISDVQLRATITNTLSNVRSAYWDYVFAVQSVDVAQQSVTLAEQLVKDNQTRVEVGTMAPIDVVQAQSQAATARQNLVAAQSTRNTAELALKRLIVSGTQDPNWSARIDPTDRPEFSPAAIDVEAAVRRALSERTDLQIVKKDVEMNDVTMKFLQDQLKPQADLVGTYGVVGLGGTQLVKSGTSINAQETGTIPGGYLDALNTMFGRGCPAPSSAGVFTCNPRWTVQLNFSYPIGISTQKASVARARVQLNQIQAQIHQVELQVATDVTNAAVTAQSNAERVQAAQAARELAQKQLEAEQSKFEVGMSTNYNVIQSQRDLATAQNNELQAVLNYRKSLVELERLQQTTLQNLNITLLSPVAAGTGGATTTTIGQ
jgi:outer membrane protein